MNSVKSVWFFSEYLHRLPYRGKHILSQTGSLLPICQGCYLKTCLSVISKSGQRGKEHITLLANSLITDNTSQKRDELSILTCAWNGWYHSWHMKWSGKLPLKSQAWRLPKCITGSRLETQHPFSRELSLCSHVADLSHPTLLWEWMQNRLAWN